MELIGNVEGLLELVGGGSTVEVTPILTSGEHIADIDVDGVTSELYAPEPPAPTEVEVTPIVISGEHIADIKVDGVTSELYAPKNEIIYSTNEQIIGWWLDEVLYQKVWQLDSKKIINSGVWDSVPIDISFIDKIIDKSFINSTDGANIGGGSIVVKDNNILSIGNEQKNATMTFDIIVLKYTKISS